MKGQELKQEKRVVAAYVEPGKGITRDDMETFREQQKIAEDKARIDSILQKSRSKLAEILNAKVFIREWTHPCLFNKDLNYQFSVSEFYPEHKIAIDKFYQYDEFQMRMSAFKKKALNKNGFSYALATPDRDMADIMADLESNEVLTV